MSILCKLLLVKYYITLQQKAPQVLQRGQQGRAEVFNEGLYNK